MPPNTDQRIAELEKTVRATQAEIASLKAQRPAGPVDQPPQRHVDPDPEQAIGDDTRRADQIHQADWQRAAQNL
jgi:hypothetical protein